MPNGTYFNDYPKFGLWTDGLYYTANAFTGSLQGILLGAFEYDQMLIGSPAQYIGYFLSINDPDYLFYSFLPADIEGMTLPPAGMPAIFAGMVDDTFGVPAPYNVDGIQLWQMDTDWATPANTTFTALDWIPVAAFDSNMCGGSRNCIPQPGTATGLDTLSNRLMYRLKYRNFGGHQVLTASHTVDSNGSDLAGVRWYEFRAPGGGTDWDVYQQGTFAPDSDSRFMGDVAMDGDGNMLIGYTVSSTTTFPSVRVAGRLAGDPLGTMGQGELEIVAGTGVQEGGNRWGDYSTVSVDPVDNCTFWIAQEYVKNTGSFDWDTRIAALTFPGCGGPAGTVDGTVTSSATLAPIEGALVSFGGLYSTLTDAAGYYSMNLPVDTYDMTVTKFGFAPGEALGVEVIEATTTTQDFELDPVGNAEFDGYVTDAGHGWPLYARIDISLAPLAPIATVYTNPFNGYYSVELPQGSEYDFLVTPLYPGYVPDMGSALLPPAGMAMNFTLSPTGDCTAPGYALGAPLLYEDFEGSFPPAGWAVVDNISSGNNWAQQTNNRTTSVGGTGKSAGAEAYNQYVLWDTELWSPPVALGLPTAISFPSNFQDYVGNGDAWFEVSTNGGSSWDELWYSTVDDPSGGVLREFDLAAYAGQTATFRWRYVANTSQAWYWHIDNVQIPGQCEVIPGALVGGFVTDANTGMAINGATVESSTGGMAMSMATPDDPGLPDGWWWMFEELPGLGPSTRTFTASAPSYAPQEFEINVVPEAMNQVGFSLEAGWLEVAPTMIDARLYGGETEIDPFDIINHGGIDANVQLLTIPIALQWDHASPVKDTGNLPGNTDPTSMGLAPEISGPIAGSQPSGLALAGVPAYGIDAYPGFNMVDWPDLTVPGTWNVIAGGMAFYPAGDFLMGDFSKLYVLDYDTNNFGYLDTTSGAFTLIANAAATAGNWSGLTAAVDGTLYASSALCGTASYLHTIDPGSGAVTPVGEITNATCMIDIAINAAGEMYGVDIVNDVLVQINTSTGAGTVIGPLGVLANYAQSMDFDEVTGTLYWAAYTASGELRIIDTSTGASTLVGAFPGGAEVAPLAIATSAGGFGLPWLELTPDGGVAPANEGVLPIDAEFIADGAWHYGLHKAEVRLSQDTPYPVDDVPAYFTKAFWDVPYGHFADAYIHALAGIRVTFGCGFGNFCPDEQLLRKHMAAFIVRMMYGADYRPPTAVGVFVDVPIEDYSTLADYIEQLFNDGITAGCMVVGDDMYFCPDDLMSRAQMAVLMVKARGWDPVDPPTGIFNDVPVDHWAAGFVERLFLEGVTAGCGGGNYCEADPVTRAQIAVFMVKAWGVEYFVH